MKRLTLDNIMGYHQEIEMEILRIEKMVEEMARGRYVKLMPKPEPRRLGLKRVWKQRFEREEYKNMTKDSMMLVEQQKMAAYLAAMESRWNDERCDFYTTRPPFLTEIVQMSTCCANCCVDFDFSPGTKDRKNWKGFSVDRIDTGLGTNGPGRLVILEEPDFLGHLYHWENVPGYENNMQPLCRGCNTIKSKFEDKGNVIVMLLTKYPSDLKIYYQERSFEQETRQVTNDYRNAFARYIYGRPVPDCEVEGGGPCETCKSISSDKIFDGDRWIRVCGNHVYPQAKALNDFERMFFGHILYDRPVDVSILRSLLESRPKEGQRDVLGVMRNVATMLMELEVEDIEDEDEDM